MKKYLFVVFNVLLNITIFSHISEAQQVNSNLSYYLELAERNYPLLKFRKLESEAAEKQIAVIKNTLIPSFDASYQVNYATYNNITGMAFPQFLIPISGPPSSTNNYSGVAGSAASLLFTWQPITFGQRRAQLNNAKESFHVSEAEEKNEIFSHKINVINAYLDWITVFELEKISGKNLDRTKRNLQMIISLVKSGIRPGVDSAIYKAEYSRAKVELMNMKLQSEQARIYFSKLIASGNVPDPSDTLYFNRLPSVIPGIDSINNPLLDIYKSDIALSESRKSGALNILNRTETWEFIHKNQDNLLKSGMYANCLLSLKRNSTSFLVPSTSLVTNQEKRFIIRLKNGKASWMDVSQGFTLGNRTEVFGNLAVGDTIIKRGNDEIKPGKHLIAKMSR